jgi:hypothetical protein
MKELNVTKIFKHPNLHDAYGSEATHGPGAANLTWLAAIRIAKEVGLYSDSDNQLIREYLSTLGAWSKDEILSFDNITLAAFVVQLTMASIDENNDRLFESDCEYYLYLGD